MGPWVLVSLLATGAGAPAASNWYAVAAPGGVANLARSYTGTLAIEVVITEMKFVSGAKRFWAGAFAGGSRSVATASLIDVESQRVLYTEEFRQQANSTAGAYSIGASDNAMIDRLAANIASWVIAHHDRAPLQSLAR